MPTRQTQTVTIPHISLDQWLAFKTVVERGSYAAAAEALNKSQSAISYALQRLNDQLPDPVLKQAGRRAVLTETGEVMLRHAEQLLAQAVQAETIARNMAAGVEAEVTVAVDSLLDIEAVVCVFEQFSRQFAHTRLRVLETSLSGTTEALLERQADIVVHSQIPPGFTGPKLRDIIMAPVAAPGHPLINRREEVTEIELRQHRQVVLRDTGSRREVDSGWLQAEQRWTVSHFSTSIKMLLSGLAFAMLPLNWVQAYLDRGELQRIRLQPSLDRNLPLYLLLADRAAAGPATRALYDLLLAELSQAAAPG